MHGLHCTFSTCPVLPALPAFFLPRPAGAFLPSRPPGPALPRRCVLALLPTWPGRALPCPQEWRTCRGTKPDSRGYTCGLWQLFHTMASRLPDTENAGAVWMAAVKGFVKNYFQCSECAKHFVRHAGGEEAAAVARKRDAVLWMWRTHNIVS